MKLILLILLPFLSKAQNQPVPGEILADSNFTCVDNLIQESNDFGINNICSTANFVEIRLTKSIGMHSELIVLSNKNNLWSAEKYYYEPLSRKKKNTQFVIKKESQADSASLFTSIFDSLKSKGLFVIPDQSVVIKRNMKEGLMAVSDGVLYTITLKAGTFYRRYRYVSPNDFAEQFPRVPEYKNFTDIVTLLNTIF